MRNDHCPIETDRVRKSIGAENTLEQDLRQEDDAQAARAPILKKVWNICGRAGRTVTVTVNTVISVDSP